MNVNDIKSQMHLKSSHLISDAVVLMPDPKSIQSQYTQKVPPTQDTSKNFDNNLKNKRQPISPSDIINYTNNGTTNSKPNSTISMIV